MKPRLSLKAKALALLALREHSRAELRRKLLRHARAEAARAAAAAPQQAPPAAGEADRAAAHGAEHAHEPKAEAGPMAADEAADPARLAERVDALLDWLAAHRYLSEDRFIESRVHARAARFGNLRIRQELAFHNVALPDALARDLRASEFERARAVWQRKFPAPAESPQERARQMRFLAARGFSGEVIRRVLRADDEPA